MPKTTISRIAADDFYSTSMVIGLAEPIEGEDFDVLPVDTRMSWGEEFALLNRRDRRMWGKPNGKPRYKK